MPLRTGFKQRERTRTGIYLPSQREREMQQQATFDGKKPPSIRRRKLKRFVCFPQIRHLPSAAPPLPHPSQPAATSATSATLMQGMELCVAAWRMWRQPGGGRCPCSRAGQRWSPPPGGWGLSGGVAGRPQVGRRRGDWGAGMAPLLSATPGHPLPRFRVRAGGRPRTR